MPFGYFYLIKCFGELDAVRTSNGFGPNPITFTEIDAWARLSGVVLEKWEVLAINRMDSARRSAIHAVTDSKVKK